MAKIAVDCDGVLADFGRAFFQMANTIWPGRVPMDYVNRSWNDLGGLSHDEQNQVWEKIKATQNWWLTLDAYTDSVGALAVFLHVTRGHDIYIVTSRTPTEGATVAWQTENWLRASGVSPVHNYIGVVATEFPSQKVKLYKSMGMDYSVDDKSETVEECDGMANHTAFLLDRPWNQDAKVKHRVASLGSMFSMIRDKE